MIHRRFIRLPVAAVFAAEVIAASAAFALGYWAAGGIGTAAASAATFEPPSDVAASLPDTAMRTVHVTWTAHAAPDGGPPAGIYVERAIAGTRSPACGSSPESPLPGATTACDDAGVASGTYTYIVTSTFRTWTAASSPSDALTVPDPTLASFTVSAPTPAATVGIPLTITVTAFDQYGAVLTGYTGDQCVTVSGPSDSPSGASPVYPAAAACLAGSRVSFTNGSATVTATLVAAETTTITVADNATGNAGISPAVTVAPGPSAALVFTRQPSTPTTAGNTFATQPRVAVQDAYGNAVTSSTSAVTLAVAGGGAAVTGCTANPVVATAGIATFTGCMVTVAGTWSLSATADSLASATSASFTIAPGPAAALAFTQQPSASATAGTALATQPVVEVQDAFGNTVTTDTSVVALASAGSGLACAASPVSAVAGVAAFADCAMTAAGTWPLTATSGALDPATSSAVTVAPGPAAALAFTQQPSNAVQNSVFPTQPKVGITDAYGNAVTSASASITLAIAPGSGTPGAVLACTGNPVTTTSGVASFAGCRIDLVGTSYRLRAIGGSFAYAESSTFNIGNGVSTTTVVASGAPQSTAVNTAFTFPLVAKVMDAYGSPVPGVAVTFTAPSSGASGRFQGAASSVTAITDAAGLATAPAFTANTTAGTYVVTASAAKTTSAGFSLSNIPGAAAQLAFTSQPSASTIAGSAFATQPVVAVQDAYGNAVTANTSAVTLAVTGGITPVTCSANPASAIAGIAAFTGCTVTRAGSGYTLTATGGTLAPATSGVFAITPATPSTLVASSGSGQSTTVDTRFGSPLVALATDPYGNPVSGVTVTFTAPGDPGAVFGTASMASATTSAAGLATSPVITADTTSGEYSVTASAAGTNAATFDLTNTPGPATQLVFLDDPSSALPGVAFGTQPTVAVADEFGNAVPAASASIALAITAGTGTAGATLTCTANPLTTTAGAASFDGCAINLEGSGYTLTATGGGFPATVSEPFDITARLQPASLRLVNGPGLTRGLIEAGDRMVIRYSGTLMASTMCSDWTDDTAPYAIPDGTLTLTGRGSPTNKDMISVATGTSCGGAFNLGYIDLGSTKASGNSSTTYSWNATIAWDPATGTLTVTIGAPVSSSTPGRVMPSVKARYYPSATLADPLGTTITGTAISTRKLF